MRDNEIDNTVFSLFFSHNHQDLDNLMLNMGRNLEYAALTNDCTKNVEHIFCYVLYTNTTINDMEMKIKSVLLRV